MEEAERLADRIVVMARGEIVADGHARDARRARPRRPPIVTFTLPARRRTTPPLGARVRRRTRRVSMRTERPMADLHELTAWALDARRWSSTDLEVRRPTLEDVYLELTR